MLLICAVNRYVFPGQPFQRLLMRMAVGLSLPQEITAYSGDTRSKNAWLVDVELHGGRISAHPPLHYRSAPGFPVQSLIQRLP